MTPPDVSICVSTLRRPQRLERLLDSLERVKLPDDCEVEVVVVDNDPLESARSIVAARCERGGPLALCYVVEPRANLSRARNASVAAARGRWLAFIDDDEVADEAWLAAYWSRLEVDHCDGWFGPVVSQPEEQRESWLGMDAFYRRPRHATGTTVGATDLRTGNAFLNSGLFRGRAFHPAFGTAPLYGEDTELFGRMRAEGAVFCWCDEASVVEFVPPERHCVRWLARRAFLGGASHTRLDRRRLPAFRRPLSALRAAAAIGVLTLAMPLAAVTGRVGATRVLLKWCVQAGHLWAQFR